jgi:hypothetical protein
MHGERQIVTGSDAQHEVGRASVLRRSAPFLVGTVTKFNHFAELAKISYGGEATYCVVRQLFWSCGDAMREGLSEFAEGRASSSFRRSFQNTTIRSRTGGIRVEQRGERGVIRREVGERCVDHAGCDFDQFVR